MEHLRLSVFKCHTVTQFVIQHKVEKETKTFLEAKKNPPPGDRKQDRLQTVDDSVHVMLAHDKKRLKEKGEKPHGYVPRAEHPLLKPHAVQAEEPDDNDGKNTPATTTASHHHCGVEQATLVVTLEFFMEVAIMTMSSVVATFVYLFAVDATPKESTASGCFLILVFCLHVWDSLGLY